MLPEHLPTTAEKCLTTSDATGTKRRLLSAANTLGLSRSTIQFIDRRTTSDFYILIGGALFTFLCFFLILYYLG